MAKTCNQTADLVAGKLSPLSGLGSLSDLDLNLLSVRQILCGYAEATRGDLLDLVVQRDVNRRGLDDRLSDGHATLSVHCCTCATQRRHSLCPRRMNTIDSRIFASLAGIRASAKHVHGGGDGLMCFWAQ